MTSQNNVYVVVIIIIIIIIIITTLQLVPVYEDILCNYNQ